MFAGTICPRENENIRQPGFEIYFPVFLKWLWYHVDHHSETAIMATKLQLNVPVSWYVRQYKSECGCPFDTWLVWVYIPQLARVVLYYTLGKFGLVLCTWRVCGHWFHSWQVRVYIPNLVCVVVNYKLGQSGCIFNNWQVFGRRSNTWLVWVYIPHLTSVVVYWTIGQYGHIFHNWLLWLYNPHLVSVGVYSTLGECSCEFNNL